MDIVGRPTKKLVKALFAVGLLLVLSHAAWPQAQNQTAPSAQTQQNQNQNPGQADKPAPGETEGSAHPTQSSPAQTPKEEVKITPREAEELFHSVDEILAF